MKNAYKLVVITLLLTVTKNTFAQFPTLRAPKQGAVYQRDNSDVAQIPIAGQWTSSNTDVVSVTVDFYARRQDGNNNVIPNAPTSHVTLNAPKGIFNGTISLSKGWYNCSLAFTENTTNGPRPTGSYQINVGVGDIFIVAGQSNGQGYEGSGISLPAPISTPELVRAVNCNYQCDKIYPPSNAMYPLGGNIGPAGTNKWCYELLGKRISDANADSYSGMPVAFFNTCSGGSTVKNWSDGANGDRTVNGYTGLGWCEGFYSQEQYPYITDNTYYQGQPYLTLKNTLNWYAQLYGVRSILWHQGEADADSRISGTVASVADQTDYTAKLNNVIQKSRDHLGEPNLSWMVARVSLSEYNNSGGTPNPNTLALKSLAGQNGSINSSPNVIPGPFTDQYNNNSTDIYRGDFTHFSESASNGLTVLANLWNTSLDPSSASITSLNRIASKPVPTISINGSGSTYTVTAESGYDGYCWVRGFPDDYDDAPPIFGCYGNTQSIQITPSTGFVRCYVRRGLNWQSTAAVLPRVDCSGCREGVVEENIEDRLGINLKLYSNPIAQDSKVEFDVPRNGLSVRLEIFDMNGKSVRLLADGSHAKGHFVYPLSFSFPSSGTYVCQLIVGDLYLTRKIVYAK